MEQVAVRARLRRRGVSVKGKRQTGTGDGLDTRCSVGVAVVQITNHRPSFLILKVLIFDRLLAGLTGLDHSAPSVWQTHVLEALNPAWHSAIDSQ